MSTRATAPLLGLLFALAPLGCKRAAPPPSPEIPAPAASTSAVGERPRCVEEPGGTTLGDGPAAPDGGEPDELLPFAAEVGEAVPWRDGFAVGAIAEEGRRATAQVVLLDAQAKLVRAVSLGAAHGDVDPPRVAARGDRLVVAMVEPQPNGRALRLGSVGDDGVAWGASVRSPRDESEAYDVALGERRGVLAWDEDGPRGGVVQLVTFDPAAPSTATHPRPVSPAKSDVEQPRLVVRPGGFWLAWVARRADAEAEPSGEGANRYRAEEIGFRWVEVVPLDELGSPMGAPRAVGPTDGHAIAFDLAPGEEGGALVVWRDDDTPSGSSGGRVLRSAVRLGSIDPPEPLGDEQVGSGAPVLLPGWIALADAAETTRLAPVSPRGELRAPLAAEPAVGLGEPIAGNADRLLVARPAGRRVRLLTIRCGAPSPPPAAAP